MNTALSMYVQTHNLIIGLVQSLKLSTNYMYINPSPIIGYVIIPRTSHLTPQNSYLIPHNCPCHLTHFRWLLPNQAPGIRSELFKWGHYPTSTYFVNCKSHKLWKSSRVNTKYKCLWNSLDTLTSTLTLLFPCIVLYILVLTSVCGDVTTYARNSL